MISEDCTPLGGNLSSFEEEALRKLSEYFEKTANIAVPQKNDNENIIV